MSSYGYGQPQNKLSAQQPQTDPNLRLQQGSQPYGAAQTNAYKPVFGGQSPYSAMPSGDYSAYSPQRQQIDGPGPAIGGQPQSSGRADYIKKTVQGRPNPYSPGGDWGHTLPSAQTPSAPQSSFSLPVGMNYSQQSSMPGAAAPQPAPQQMPQSAFSAQYGQPGGGYSSQPSIDQRDAFIQRINDLTGGLQAGQGVYQGQGAPPPAWGQAPKFDVPKMWSDAAGMVQGGWKNPLNGLL